MPRRATGKPAPKQPALGESVPVKPERSEEDILLQRPIEVTLADKPYTIKLLPMRAQFEWRKKVVPLFSGGLALNNISTDSNPAEFQTGLASILIEAPEKLLDLFFDYARELDREEIEDTATEVEVAVALEKIVAVVLPSPLMTALTGKAATAVR